MSFNDKVILITGASSGIGASTAIHFVKEGADVAIVGRNELKLKNVAAACSKYGKEALIIVSDISEETGTKNAMERTIENFGKLDVLVNNAGFSIDGTILGGDILESYDSVMKTNVRAVIHLTTLAAPHLIKTKGNVVNISSIAAMTTLAPPFLSYSISKAALDHFTRGAALELSSFGVRVNSVNPGPVLTNFIENAGHNVEDWDKFKETTALRRIAEPKEIADLIMFLASNKAQGITGSVFVSDNGAMIKN